MIAQLSSPATQNAGQAGQYDHLLKNLPNSSMDHLQNSREATTYPLMTYQGGLIEKSEPGFFAIEVSELEAHEVEPAKLIAAGWDLSEHTFSGGNTVDILKTSTLVADVITTRERQRIETADAFYYYPRNTRRNQRNVRGTYASCVGILIRIPGSEVLFNLSLTGQSRNLGWDNTQVKPYGNPNYPLGLKQSMRKLSSALSKAAKRFVPSEAIFSFTLTAAATPDGPYWMDFGRPGASSKANPFHVVTSDKDGLPAVTPSAHAEANVELTCSEEVSAWESEWDTPSNSPKNYAGNEPHASNGGVPDDEIPF